MSEYKFIRVKPTIHETIKEMAEEEGRHIIKMLEILVEEYKKSKEGK